MLIDQRGSITFNLEKAVRRTLAGDQDAAALLYENLGHRLRGILSRRIPEHERGAIPELAHQAVTEVIISLDRFIPDYSTNLTFDEQFNKWSNGVVRNVHMTVREASSRQPFQIPLEEAGQIAEASSSEADPFTDTKIKSKIAELLGNELAQVFWMKESGMDHRAIASTLGIPQKKSWQLLKKAKEIVEEKIRVAGYKPLRDFQDSILSSAASKNTLAAIKLFGDYYVTDEKVKSYYRKNPKEKRSRKRSVNHAPKSPSDKYRPLSEFVGESFKEYELREAALSGRLKAVRQGRFWFIDDEDFQRFRELPSRKAGDPDLLNKGFVLLKPNVSPKVYETLRKNTHRRSYILVTKKGIYITKDRLDSNDFSIDK